MSGDLDSAVTFHRTDDGHIAACFDSHAMIALPARDGRLSVWSAVKIDLRPRLAITVQGERTGARLASLIADHSLRANQPDGFRRSHAQTLTKQAQEMQRATGRNG